MKRTVYQDGNGSGLIMVDVLGEYVPREDYEELKELLERFVSTISAGDAKCDGMPFPVSLIKEAETLTNKGE